MLKQSMARMILKIAGWELVGDIPAVSKAIFIVAPHTSNWDGFWLLCYKIALGMKIRFFAKHTLFWWPLGSILKNMGAIPVERARRGDQVRNAIKSFNSHEQIFLGLAPEGTRKLVPYWKTGFYRIAIAVHVPVVLGFIDYRQKRLGIGKILRATGDVAQDLDQIRQYYLAFTPRHPASAGPIEFPPGQVMQGLPKPPTGTDLP